MAWGGSGAGPGSGGARGGAQRVSAGQGGVPRGAPSANLSSTSGAPLDGRVRGSYAGGGIGSFGHGGQVNRQAGAGPMLQDGALSTGGALDG